MESETPPWVEILSKIDAVLAKQVSMESMLDTMKSDFNKLTVDVQKVSSDVRDLQNTVKEHDDGLTSHEEMIENTKLRGMIASVKHNLDEQIDRGLRNHVTFTGLKRLPNEKTWDDTTSTLVTWLKEHVESTFELDAIERCHRGPRYGDQTPEIFCRFTKWKDAEKVRDAMRGKAINGVGCKDKLSKGTQARFNNAMLLRRELKNENNDLKLFVKYPAKLMCKAPGDEKYHVVKEF